jgi:DNA modification methylase
MEKQRENLEVAAVFVPVDRLKPWADNPRDNEDAVAEVAASIRRFGFGAPIIAREADGEVIAGHTRLKAAISLGLTQVPVRFLPLDPVEAHLLALADNRLGEIAEWSTDTLREVLQSLPDGTDTSGLGWSDEEIEALLQPPADEEAPGGLDERDAPPEPPPDDVEPESERGVLYQLGPHRLLCGDCRDPADVARLLSEPVALAFTSPPYASQRTYDEGSGFKPIPPDEYVDWFEAVQANVRAHLAEDGSWFVNIKAHCEDGERHTYVMELALAHVRRWGWRFIDEFCWERGGVPGKWPNRLKNAWEPVYHFASQPSIKLRHDNIGHETTDAIDYSPLNTKTHSGFISGSSGRRDGIALPSNVLHVHSGPHQIADDKVKHTATFPVGLPEFFVRAFTDPGDLVYDPFLGSGTTLIASAIHGRRCAGTEISPRYCDVIRRRWTRWAIDHGQDPGPGRLDG